MVLRVLTIYLNNGEPSGMEPAARFTYLTILNI